MASAPFVPPPPPPHTVGAGGPPPGPPDGSRTPPTTAPDAAPQLVGGVVAAPERPVSASAAPPAVSADPTAQGKQPDPAPPLVPPVPPAAPPTPPGPEAKTKDDADLPLPPVKLDPIALVLSYLIPGLGQVYQGRVGKGLLFFFGLYGLFFYGMWMGHWRNVWLPDATELPDVEIAGQRLGGTAKALSYRPQFLGQFWIGVAAWPAVVQYAFYDPAKDTGPVFGSFERTPPEGSVNDPPEKITLNKLQREGNKRWDLGWVYTVIAGVLNLLVIYDAFAGPMFREPLPEWKRKDEEAGW
ncbi:MAG: hypothetical protein JWO38_2794 [Gemmataceae bacterium]|nr:hypothetical protein [Gemmataceae bacterium]